MKRASNVLLLVLLLQCAIAAFVFWPPGDPEKGSSEQGLAPFAAEAIDELRIGDEFDNEVSLLRSGKQWLLPDLQNLPADAAKVDALLAGLTNKEANWPIARSVAARQRFQVADYYYQKRLTLLSAGKKVAAIYFGTSPGFRKTHARNATQNAIYSVTLDNVEVAAISADWLEPKLLQVRSPVRIDADLYNLRFENGKWLSGTGGNPDPQELEALFSALKNLQVDGVADEDLQRELSATEAALVLKIQSLTGEVTLQLISLHDSHYIRSTEYPLFFKLSAYDYDRLANIDFRLISGEEKRQ